MDDVEARVSNRIELRVVHALASTLDAWMTVSSEGHAISVPVRTQLGMPITVTIGDNTLALHEGKLFIHDGGGAPHAATSTKKRTYGLVHYLARPEVKSETHEQFHVKLFVPTDQYRVIWDLGARGHLPRLISLQVKGLHGNAEWDVSDVGSMLLIEDFSFSFPISF